MERCFLNFLFALAHLATGVIGVLTLGFFVPRGLTLSVAKMMAIRRSQAMYRDLQ